MKTYTDPVFMPNECNKRDILAAYDPEYHKAMIISDTGIEGNSVIKKGQEVSVIYPSASTKEEQAKIVKKHTDHYGVKINQAVLGPLALVEFYKSQSKITMIIYVLLQFVRNLTKYVFLTDKVFCQSCTVTYIIVAYLVFVVDKFLEAGKPFLLNGFHFIADRRTLQFKHHAAVGVDFPERRIAV